MLVQDLAQGVTAGAATTKRQQCLIHLGNSKPQGFHQPRNSAKYPGGQGIHLNSQSIHRMWKQHPSGSSVSPGYLLMGTRRYFVHEQVSPSLSDKDLLPSVSKIIHGGQRQYRGWMCFIPLAQLGKIRGSPFLLCNETGTNPVEISPEVSSSRAGSPRHAPLLVCRQEPAPWSTPDKA